MFVRDLAIEPPLALAPMEGVTDLPFRRLIRSIGGCGLTVTEFVPGSALVGRQRSGPRAAEIDPDERPVSIQVYGRDPDVLADAARWVEDSGASIVDLNMGCPSKKVCAHSGGSALLKEPELAQRIVRAIRAAVRLPFTVKMRAGWDPDHRNAPEIAAMCEGEGVEAIAVHWRTRADGYGGERTLETVARVVQRVSVPVFANGDIVDVESARSTLAETGAAGVMIGRGAIRDPWVFRRIERALRGLPPLVVDDAERERAVLGWFDAVRRDLEANKRPRGDVDKAALGRLKQLAKYFFDGDASADVKRELLHARSSDEAEALMRRWFQARQAA